MRSAALHGKVGLLEDVLTASFVDLLRTHYLPEVVRAFLKLAAIVGDDGRSSGEHLEDWLAPANWDTYNLILWPRWSVGQPDAVLDLLSGHTRVARVVIEAKTGSPKSGTDDGDPSEPLADPRSGDQLAVYLWEASVLASPGERVAGMYLTHHGAPPREELSASKTGARRRALFAPIAWAAWRDVEKLLSEQPRELDAFGRDVADMLSVLRLYGYCRFRGDWRASVDALRPAAERAVWFGTPSPAPRRPTPPQANRWRLGERMRPAEATAFWSTYEPLLRTFRGGVASLRPAPARTFYPTGAPRC